MAAGATRTVANEEFACEEFADIVTLGRQVARRSPRARCGETLFAQNLNMGDHCLTHASLNFVT